MIDSNHGDKKNDDMEVSNKKNLYEKVLRTMSECVFIFEKSGQIVDLNENFEKIVGMKSVFFTESNFINFDFVRDDGSPILYSELPGPITLAQGISFENFILGIKNDVNSDIKWISINSTPLKINDNDVQTALVTMSDITERKQMENALIQAKEEAEKANLAKSDFLSKMSHELRTPLNGILGFAQLLEIDESLNEQQRDFVQEILSGGDHLLHLINDILDLSRIETGKLKVSIDEVNLLTIINECINIVQPLAKRKNVSIHKRLVEKITVLADPVRLKQILLNLLDNAIKYNCEFGEVYIYSYLEGHILGLR